MKVGNHSGSSRSVSQTFCIHTLQLHHWRRLIAFPRLHCSHFWVAKGLNVLWNNISYLSGTITDNRAMLKLFVVCKIIKFWKSIFFTFLWLFLSCTSVLLYTWYAYTRLILRSLTSFFFKFISILTVSLCRITI